MADRSSFILYLKNRKQWGLLSNEQKGILLEAIFDYVETGAQIDTDNGLLLMAFSFITGQIDIDAEKYDDACKKRAEAARKRWEKQAGNANDANACFASHEMQTDANDAYNDNECDNDYDNDCDNDCKKENNKEKSADKPQKHANEISEVVQHLNAKAGTNYRPSSTSTQRHLNARFAEGYTVADCKSVIDKKCAEWKGTEFEKFLRPETLFGSKFESYLNAQAHSRGRPQQPAHSSINMEDVEKLFNQCGIKAQL